MNYPKVAVVVLNWNGWEDTLECLKSLFQIEYSNFEVLVVDNGSTNESVNKILEWFNLYKDKAIDFSEYSETEHLVSKELNPERIRLHFIKNAKNYGFSGGNNQAFEKAVRDCYSEYVLLLNNDTVVDKNFLTKLVEGMESNLKIAAEAPLVYYHESTPKNVVYCFGGSVNMFTGFVKHRFMGEVNPELPPIQFVNFLEGSALFLRSSVFLKEKIFDDKFFAYFEDVDLSYRLSKKGYLLACISKAKIWHKVSKSSKATKKAYYLIRNLIWFIKKDATFIQKLVFFMYLPFRFAYLVLIKSRLSPPYIKSVAMGMMEGLFK